MPLLQQVKLIHLLEEVTVTERADMYESLFALSPSMRASMSEYLMGKMLAVVPSSLSQMTQKEKGLMYHDVSALGQIVQTYINDTKMVNYRQVLFLSRLYFLEWVLEQDSEKRASLLRSVQQLEISLEILSPDNPQNYWVIAQREIFEGKPESALTTLQEANSRAPGVETTIERISSVEEFLRSGGNTLYFAD
jgi:hypothetical protein